jgi:hypothetical protein
MSTNLGALIKAAQIIQSLPGCEEELEKTGGKLETVWKAVTSPTGKIVGGVTAAGAATAGGFVAGRVTGRKKGLREGEQAGRQAQRKADVSQFRGAAKNIYALGRRHQRASDVAALRQHFLRGMIGQKPGKQKQIAALPEPPASKNMKSLTYRPNVKKAEDRIATGVYEGWANGRISVDDLKNLPPVDLEKIAAVVINRISEGDKRASILWRVLSSA